MGAEKGIFWAIYLTSKLLGVLYLQRIRCFFYFQLKPLSLWSFYGPSKVRDFLYFGGTMCATMRSIWMSLWLFFVVYVLGVVLVVGVSVYFATGSMPYLLYCCVCYLESGLCIRIECRVWVHFWFQSRLSTRVAFCC